MDKIASYEYLLSVALDIATKAHKGQIDKAGVDYINHPKKVSELIICDNTEFAYKCKIGALLHDTIEDTSVTAEYLLEKNIPKDVVQAVVLVSKEKGFNLKQYFSRIKKNPIARAIKLADLTHNMDISRIKEPSEKDYKRLKKYKKEFDFLLNDNVDELIL